MNSLTIIHGAIVGLIVVCATVLGVSHAISGGDVTNIYVGCLGSLSGHAVGFAAGKESVH